ncbi:MAG: hypothetical protein JWO65_213, partial [Sphingomonas bacterium]|nr:hypothetical protein [Sphingomonas bacterium]
MRIRNRAALALLAGAAAIAVAVPVFGQQSPQSILPPGFGAPAAPPPPIAAPAAPQPSGGEDVP